MAAEHGDEENGVVTGFVACPVHLRSADLGTCTVLVDVRTGRVEILQGWAHQVWTALARTGDPHAAVEGARAEQVDELVRRLHADGLLNIVAHPRPWPVPAAVATRPSWGTQEVPAGVVPPGRTGVWITVLAGVALASVLLAREAGRRSRSFHRTVRLLTGATREPHHQAQPATVARALHSVRNVASVLPFRVACLEETAAAMLVLAFTGQRAGWCHGIAADPIRLHAWIALDGHPVAEPASTTRYTPLLHIPDQDSARQSGELP